MFSFTGDHSFVVRELLSLKSSTKFLWPFSLVNPVVLSEMFSTFQKTEEKIFETEISAHEGCALGTPNFLDLLGIKRGVHFFPKSTIFEAFHVFAQN